MALNITNAAPTSYPNESFGSVRVRSVDADFDSSYSSGGESLNAVELGFPKDSTLLLVLASPKAGLSFEYDYTTKKLKALSPVKKYTATEDAASVAAVTSQDEASTFTGVLSTDEVIGWKGPNTLEARAVIKGARISAANTVQLRMENSSAASVDPASGTYTIYTVAANGAAQEIANATDLSAVTDVRVLAFAR